ncbi:GGDEF domain-containing protein [Terasakiella sp. A23]|uniref:GGDEF domain-containing protein n=1 Tax=Terasakiella sp. FCG-A23 TaxID=3080561 RepID=UPI002954013D|nr:GGDEF domain-containing protein [Terasakiella sp. A23]MDV7341378.1 GGDEF domain-containing protein [Terasakiella sp. A23]
MKAFENIKAQLRIIPEYMELLLPFAHSAHIRRHRARIIASRVGLLSLLFAVVIPLWVVIDFFAFSWPTWAILALLRTASAVAFFGLYILHQNCRTLNHAYLLLGGMMAIPPIFYLISQPFLMGIETGTLGAAVTSAYALLPFIVVAGLSVFPLTALEVLVTGTAVMIVVILGAAQQQANFDLNAFITSTWLMIVVIGVSIFSGMSQLHYMISLINQASKDLLTGAFTRRSGEEYLDLQFRIASRTGAPMSLLFMDVDKFKSVNDDFGHEQGDQVLKQVAKGLQNCLRRSDQLIRWGGEEFVILLPNTDADHIIPVLNRLSELTLGNRPDGKPVTISIGASELTMDECDDWVQMVEKADHRMYEAKKTGRNKSIGPKPETNIENIIAA